MSELNPNPKERDKVQHGLMEPQLKKGGQEALNNLPLNENKLPLNELNGIIRKTIETIKVTVKNEKESDIGSKTLELE